MSKTERNIDWLMSLSRAQFNSAVYAKGNADWRSSLTAEQKADLAMKTSAAHKGKVLSQETKDKMSMSKLGKPLPRTPEWQAKITAALKGKKGCKHSDESKRKISMANTGRLKGIKRGPQNAQHKLNHTASLVAAGLTVRCQTPLGIFNSRAEAAKAHGVDPVSISNWMKKEKPGFCYLDEHDIAKCEQEKIKLRESLINKVSRKSDRAVITPLGNFSSILSAAKAYGIDRSTLADRIKRGWKGYHFA